MVGWLPNKFYKELERNRIILLMCNGINSNNRKKQNYSVSILALSLTNRVMVKLDKAEKNKEVKGNNTKQNTF